MKTSKMAQMAYRAFGSWSEWKTPQGKPMPEWDELPMNLQNAWTAAAETVAVFVRKQQLSKQAASGAIAQV